MPVYQVPGMKLAGESQVTHITPVSLGQDGDHRNARHKQALPRQVGKIDQPPLIGGSNTISSSG